MKMNYYVDKDGWIVNKADIDHVQLQKEKTNIEIYEYIEKIYELIPEEYLYNSSRYFFIFNLDLTNILSNNRRMRKILFHILRIERRIE